MRVSSVTRCLLLAGVVALSASACGSSTPSSSGSSGPAQSSSSGVLRGLFRISPGVCGAAGVTSGSWFRMVQPNGKTATGPFVTNGDSSCADKTWTPLLPGTAGGLLSGTYQPQPAAAFDGAGNSTAGAIVAPTPFFAVKFGLSTNPTDPQTGQKVPAPLISSSGGTLSGQLESVAASWNHQQFNQGAPKPGGGLPGLTTEAHGTYDSSSHSFTLEWASQIVGGPFNNFTGIWHLAGTFQSS